MAWSMARPRRKAARMRARGFTLIEVMVTVAIVAILAAIAMPNYLDYLTRGKLIEGTAGLSNARQRTEQIFLDQRSYAGACTAAKQAENQALKNFQLTCPVEQADKYTLQADGMGFTYTIDETGTKVTKAVPSGWVASGNCWTIRKNGGCT